MRHLGKFISAVMADWMARMSGPLTVPFAVGAFLLPSTAARISFACLAVLAALITCYRVWDKEYERAEIEKGKNEVAPAITINMHNAVPHGKIGTGLTDLFFYLELVLKAPSQVSIQDFSLMIFNRTQSSTIVATDDVLDWEIMKKESEGRSHVRCVPLTRELTRRGDPNTGVDSFSHSGSA
jgi:hypothetical protein